MPHVHADLVHEVEVAWADARRPPDGYIVAPGGECEFDGVQEYFAGTTWRNHKPTDLRVHCAAVSTYFSDRAYSYWLAAFLVAAVQEPGELSQGIDSLWFSLDLSTPRAHGRLEALSKRQRRALLHVLKFLKDEYGCAQSGEDSIRYLEVLTGEA